MRMVPELDGGHPRAGPGAEDARVPEGLRVEVEPRDLVVAEVDEDLVLDELELGDLDLGADGVVAQVEGAEADDGAGPLVRQRCQGDVVAAHVQGPGGQFTYDVRIERG